MKVYNVYKPLGKTPLQSLQALREKLKIPIKVKLTYAGRLDPMAEGVLLILGDVNTEQKNKFLKLSKVYEAEILFGFSSDSFDSLGVAKKHKRIVIGKKELQDQLSQYVGVAELPLPAYASPPIQGKPLFQWAREGDVHKIIIPKRAMEINSVHYKTVKKYSSAKLLEKVERNIKKVSGDFRQKIILRKWKTLLQRETQSYMSVRCIIACESGTYIRSLADDWGKKYNTGSVLLGLRRVSVGKYTSVKSLHV